MRATQVITAMMAICCAVPAFAEEVTGGSLIAKYLEASGGKEKMASVKTRIETGTLTLTDLGMEAAYISKVSPPNSVTSMDFAGTMVKNGLTDGVTWTLNPFESSAKEETGAEAEVFVTLGLIETMPMAKCLGEEDVDGAACYKVETPSPSGSTLTFWFDKKSGLLTKSVDDAGQMTTFGDYKEVDGLTLPHKVSQTGGPYAIEIVLTKIEIDAEIEDDAFDIPEEIK